MKDFGLAAARRAFRNRWFGHYADTQPGAFLLALTPQGDVAGYVAGCIDSFSAASRIIVSDIDYFTPAFCSALKNYPSHFHINVRPGYQGKGIGHRLIARFLQICAEAGSPGIHVVTGASSRAVRFYEACGFRQAIPYAGASPGLAVLVRATRAPSH
ncbi:MAG: GNAT family N-acetyltransferase [Rhodomicrobium sp.]